jgi:glycerol-3-phosphate dehydrogenase
VPSRGTHLIFKKGFLKENQGMIIPETKDGRLLFVINYFGHPLVGTTDELCEATHFCEPTQEEIDFIIEEIKPFLGKDYDYKGNLMSAWAGLRPLVKSSPDDKPTEDQRAWRFRDYLTSYFQGSVRWLAFKVHGSKKKKNATAAISRNHVIEVTKSGLVSLMGGKWTSFREQGEETIDRILADHPEDFKHIKYESGQTLNFNLIGSYGKVEVAEGIQQGPKALYQ